MHWTTQILIVEMLFDLRHIEREKNETWKKWHAFEQKVKFSA